MSQNRELSKFSRQIKVSQSPNTVVFTSDIINVNGSIVANGSTGSSGQVLTSSAGGNVYWSTAGGSGTVTQVNSANGVGGGGFTTSGTLYVVPNTGIVANTSGVFVNSNYIATISCNNANYLGGTAYTSYVQTSGSYTISGVHTHIVNTIFNSNMYVNGAIVANGSTGSSGQVLTSSAGGNVYWSTAGGGSGTVTLVNSANGIGGGPFSTSGTLYVVPNTGIVANTSGVFVNANYIATISANNANYLGGVVSTNYPQINGSYTISGVYTYTANININAGIVANGSPGTAGQVLTTDGSKVYWSTAGGGGSPAGSTGQIQFNNAGSFGANSTFVYSAGKVGIGTTTPTTSLTVNAAYTATIGQIDVLNTGNFQQITLRDLNNPAASKRNLSLVGKYITANTTMQGWVISDGELFLSSNGGTTPGLTIYANNVVRVDGKLGVGTISPTAPLNVNAAYTAGIGQIDVLNSNDFQQITLRDPSNPAASKRNIALVGKYTSASSLMQGYVVADGELFLSANGGNSPAIYLPANGDIIVGNGRLTLGSVTGNAAALKLYGSSGSGAVTVTAPAGSVSWTMTMPANTGVANYYLQTDGTGKTKWAAAVLGAQGTGGYTLLETIQCSGNTAESETCFSGDYPEYLCVFDNVEFESSNNTFLNSRVNTKNIWDDVSNYGSSGLSGDCESKSVDWYSTSDKFEFTGVKPVNEILNGEIKVYQPHNSNMNTSFSFEIYGSNGSRWTGSTIYKSKEDVNGIQFFSSENTNFANGKIYVYGRSR